LRYKLVACHVRTECFHQPGYLTAQVWIDAGEAGQVSDLEHDPNLGERCKKVNCPVSAEGIEGVESFGMDIVAYGSVRSMIAWT
jgi:hypothetical protein